MSEKSQKTHLKRVYSEELGRHSENDDLVDRPLSGSSQNLAVSYKELVNSYRITTSTLENIWKKASELVSTSGLNAVVPGEGNTSNKLLLLMVVHHIMLHRKVLDSFFAVDCV